VIVNLPGANVQFRQFGHSNFTFHAPFAGSTPPYTYALDPVAEVPGIVTNHAGVGKIGLELWQMEQFTPAQLDNPAISGPAVSPASDGVSNFAKYALGLLPFVPAPRMLTPLRMEGSAGILSYRRPATATDVSYRVEVSNDLTQWSSDGVVQERIGAGADGLETWEARSTASAGSPRFFRLVLER
jgi:hypothetical protein